MINTKLLIHFDGINGSVIFTDESSSAHLLTAVNNVQVDTSLTVFGSGSGLFTASTSDRILLANNPDFNFGTSDFTIEARMRFNSLGGTQNLIAYGASGGPVQFIWDGNSSQFRIWGESSFVISSNVQSLAINTWYHVAFVRSGNIWTIYLDGINIGSVTDTRSLGDANHVNGILIGAVPTAPVQYFDGNLDEFRLSNIARWTVNFTPPTAPYGESGLNSTETISLSDSGIISSNIQKNLTGDLKVSDAIQVFPAISTDQVDTFKVSDLANLSLAAIPKDVISITDNIVLNVDLEKAIGQNTINISDTANIFATTGPASFASKIISFNPLIIVTDVAPLTIVRVDVTNPAIPTWQKFKINGITNAKDISYDSILNLIFIVGADGKILQVDPLDFNTTTIFDTGDLNNFLSLSIMEGQYRLFAGTNDPTGELITMDNRAFAQLGLNIQTLVQVRKNIMLNIDTVNALSLALDIQVLSISSASIGLDIRVLPQPIPATIITDPIILFSELAANPIKQTDFHVFIDGTEVDDLELDSININHTIGELSTAGFKVRRKHDDYNRTIAGASSIIDQQGLVTINIKGNLEFTGNIKTLNSFSEQEIIEVICEGTEKINERRQVTIPMTGLNEKLQLFDCLVNDPVYFNPLIDPNDTDPQFFTGIRVDLGKRTAPHTAINSNRNDPFSLATLGSFSDTGLIDDIKDGLFKPEQNWTYFWKVAAFNYFTGKDIKNKEYIGTSIAHLTEDIWDITKISFQRQRKYNTRVSEIGFFELGVAPFKEISVKNSELIQTTFLQDGESHLIEVITAGFDYVQYAKIVAGLEFEKLTTINDTVLPIASGNISLLLDGYFYYQLKLLTRINIDNTTQAGIFNKNHGFPVAIKGISISSANMQVTLNCDNGKSRIELDEIDARFPDADSSEYKYPKQSWHIDKKFDFSKNSNLDSEEKEFRV